eukprot:Blabericola_migrator_1__9663@NODE_5283_length_820_cov_292_807437_g3381_i0_p1_GENE_NODE_5283_length_820_cov_292_807437_g3381_i0NODE_5283_length_820_cov_292_807437_g3381_i0_p1_ORF_typecomplete_len208_score56_76Ribosomal_L13/PF00572_18/9_5e24_NODE_5283_length_820_cov_292_807437_g3381_i0112735
MSVAPNKTFIVDGKGHLMGRLAAACAKQLLEGQNIVVTRCEEILISGALFRNHLKYLEFLRKKSNSNPRKHSQIHYRSPSMIFKRVLRGMLPHKTLRGTRAHERLTVCEGVPPKYAYKKRVIVPKALAVLRIKPDMPTTRLGDLAAKVGYNRGGVIERLEAKRKEKAQADYEVRRKALDERRAKRQAAIANAPADIKDALALLTRVD